MGGLLAWLAGSRIGRAIAAAGGVLAVLAGAYLAGRRRGRDGETLRQLEAEHERAEEIRRRAAEARRGAPVDAGAADERLRKAGRLRD